MTGNGSSRSLQTETSIRVNGEAEPLAAATVAELLASKGIVEPRGIAVALNGAVVRRAEWSATRLQSGDTIEIVHARQGG
jgi:sulfur carrier protein